MQDVALAYQRTGNQQRANEALEFVNRRFESMIEQGLNSYVFSRNQAAHAAMQGDNEKAIRLLQEAAAGGAGPGVGLLKGSPHLAVLEGDPRLADIEATMLATLNRDRAVVGLPPMNEDFEVVQ